MSDKKNLFSEAEATHEDRSVEVCELSNGCVQIRGATIDETGVKVNGILFTARGAEAVRIMLNNWKKVIDKRED